jgi:hypothetical protein
MLAKTILALLFASAGFVQAVPIRYATTGEPTDLDSNPGVRPLPVRPTDPPTGEVHILPYYGEDDVSTGIRRELLEWLPFDPQANPGVRPLDPPSGVGIPAPVY